LALIQARKGANGEDDLWVRVRAAQLSRANLFTGAETRPVYCCFNARRDDEWQCALVVDRDLCILHTHGLKHFARLSRNRISIIRSYAGLHADLDASAIAWLDGNVSV
jgi:hypothetical protein